MSISVINAFAATLSICCVFGTSYAAVCEPPSTEMILTIISRRNLTGHWEASLSLQHDGSGEEVLEDKTSGPFELDLKHQTTKCGGKQVIKIGATVVVPPRRPGPGYELFPGLAYYKFHAEPLVWEEARKACVREGAHLAIVNSEEEIKVLQQIFGRHPKIKDVLYNDFAFIGFHDLYTEGSYITVFGDPLSKTGFTRWCANQPDDAPPAEDCGSMHRIGCLNDLVCNSKHAFICEQEIW